MTNQNDKLSEVCPKQFLITTITADATVSASVIVPFDGDVEAAKAVATAKEFYRKPENASFELDEGNELRDAYIPDGSITRLSAQKRRLPFLPQERPKMGSPPRAQRPPRPKSEWIWRFRYYRRKSSIRTRTARL